MKEVIPNQLVVISLNTLYWFDTNPVVDGCNIKTDPGSHQFRWLRVVLKELRARGMKAWLSGHVPPTKDNWEPTCRDRYIAWTHEYRDVIIGGLYGHMNIDHFVVHDIVEAYKQKKEEGVAATHDESFVEPSLLSHAEASEDFDQDDHIKTCKPKHYIDPSDHDSFTAQGKADYFEEIRLGYEKAAKTTTMILAIPFLWYTQVSFLHTFLASEFTSIISKALTRQCVAHKFMQTGFQCGHGLIYLTN